MRKAWIIGMAAALSLGVGAVAITASSNGVFNEDAVETRAETKTSTLTFAAACGGSGTADDGASWTITSDGTESNFDSTKGIHYGTGSAKVQYIKLTTNKISGTITKVVVNASTASGVSATASVTVGGSEFGGDPQSISSAATDYTFNGSAIGEIVVTVTKPSSAQKALYVKSVAVTYETSGGDTPAAALTGITLGGSYQTEFTVGDTFNHDGMTVTADYDDDTHLDVTADATWSDPDMTTAGNKTVMVSYLTQSKGYTITVNETVDPTVDPNKIVFEDLGLTNGEQYTSFGEDDGFSFTISFSGGANDGKYYETGLGIRTYGGGSFTITANDEKAKFEKLEFAWHDSNKPDSSDAFDVGTYNTSTSVWTGIAHSVTATRPSGGGHWRLQSVKVTYGAQPVTGLSIDPSALTVPSTDTSAHTITVEVTPSDADNPALTIDKGGENVATVSASALTGSGSFTITGKGATSGSQTITVSTTDGSNISQTFTLTAVDGSEPVLVGIDVDQSGLTHKTQYVGNDFDPTGLVFTPVYDKTKTNPDVITADDFTWSELTAGEAVVGTYKTDISIKVNITEVTVKVDTLEVTIIGDDLTDPTFYTTGDWNHNGLTATAVYDSGTEYSGALTWSYDPETPADMGATDADILTIKVEAESGEFATIEVLVEVIEPKRVIDERTDTLNRALTGITGSNYKDWSGLTDASGVVYAGQSAGDKDSIQIRSKNSNSGIVVTDSSCVATKITVTFQEDTISGRTVDIYGKNSAYAAATELYNTADQGELIGSVVYDKTNTTVTVTLSKQYRYIGLRSRSDPLFMSEVVIDWEHVYAPEDVALVDNFVANYMHLDIRASEGSCKGDGGWYLTAKPEYNKLSDEAKNIIRKSGSNYDTVTITKKEKPTDPNTVTYTYADIKLRFETWATFNNDAAPWDGNDDIKSKIQGANVVKFESKESGGAIAVVAAVAGVGAISVAGLFLINRRRKEI